MLHRRAMSTRENSRASSATLTATLRAATRTPRQRGREELPDSGTAAQHTLTRDSGETYVDDSGHSPYNFPAVLVKIIMIAPEPFFEPRGTPFSEYHRIRALLDLGHTVDLVTYPFGKNIDMPGLRIFRAARPPFITHVKIGPSAAKLFLDMTLTLTALNQARKEKYDAVHSHEEGAAIGV